ncbi:PAS domain S-box-containing protein [Desulfosalsimonas propionicica]|uniref:histidine kinase n=1 Tax=Desulfosalsimonas propionicica TaxID=332175 RepID=A0A7W0C7G8_9BACT|nr:ATP-binding protein [Desulfosalsimonas propionicica]MBA2880588.1 PAS domain S-box-containing protein [Desulfosalsimonas propionicica]
MSKLAISFQRLKIKSKLLLGLSAVVLCLGLILGIIGTHIASTELIKENKERGKVLAANLAYRSDEALLTRDFLRLKNLLDELKSANSDLAYAFILNSAGRVLVHTFEQGFPVELFNIYPENRPNNDVTSMLLLTNEGKIYDFVQPVEIQQEPIGTVRIGIHRQRLEAMINRLRLWIFGLTAAVTIGAIILVLWFSSKFTNRIKCLTESANEVIKGNLEVQSATEPRRQCWQINKCQAYSCPAYGDTRRRCWYITGTLCPSYHLKQDAQGDLNCLNCPVYQQNAGDEIQELAEAFDYMAMTLQERIDQARSAEKELSRQKELLRTTLDVTPDMVALQDENLVYRAANKAFCSYFQLNESDIVGKTDFDIFSESQADQNYHEDRQILQTGKPMSKEISVKQGDMVIWFHILKVPVYAEGRISGLLLTARDITVIKQYQDRLVQSQKMEDLGRLAGGVAHEINTPLGIILGYAQMLLEDVDSDSQMAADLKIIEKQTKICSSIVSDLLGFSRQSQTTRTDVDINESIQEVISLVEHTFSLNRVRILYDLDPNIPEIEGDKDKLKQVWLNLLNNALDAIEHDGCIRITTKLCAHRRRVALTVTDTGTGIKQEILNKIFDPFFSTKPVGKGTGLGLSVTFGIIQNHGGRINVLSPAPKEYLQEMGNSDSCTGPGTVFLVELPLWQMELPEEECEELGLPPTTRQP